MTQSRSAYQQCRNWDLEEKACESFHEQDYTVLGLGCFTLFK